MGVSDMDVICYYEGETQIIAEEYYVKKRTIRPKHSQNLYTGK